MSTINDLRTAWANGARPSAPGADLQDADLWGTDLRGADLRAANLPQNYSTEKEES